MPVSFHDRFQGWRDHVGQNELLHGAFMPGRNDDFVAESVSYRSLIYVPTFPLSGSTFGASLYIRADEIRAVLRTTFAALLHSNEAILLLSLLALDWRAINAI